MIAHWSQDMVSAARSQSESAWPKTSKQALHGSIVICDDDTPLGSFTSMKEKVLHLSDGDTSTRSGSSRCSSVDADSFIQLCAVHNRSDTSSCSPIASDVASVLTAPRIPRRRHSSVAGTERKASCTRRTRAKPRLPWHLEEKQIKEYEWWTCSSPSPAISSDDELQPWSNDEISTYEGCSRSISPDTDDADSSFIAACTEHTPSSSSKARESRSVPKRRSIMTPQELRGLPWHLKEKQIKEYEWWTCSAQSPTTSSDEDVKVLSNDENSTHEGCSRSISPDTDGTDSSFIAVQTEQTASSSRKVRGSRSVSRRRLLLRS